MNLQDLAAIAEIIGFFAVMAAIELIRSFQNTEFTTGFRLIHSLPADISAAEFSAQGTAYIDAAYAMGMKLESTGVLVYRGVIPIAAVEQLIGGITITLWKRLSSWIYAERDEKSQEQILEWFQWLAEKLEERAGAEHEPANIRFKDWKSQ